MKVTVYGKSANHPRFEQTLMKFATGVIDSGDDAFLSYDEEYYDCDVAVIFGSWKDRDMAHHRVKRDIVSKAKKFIVLETPIIGRGPVKDVMDDDWYRIGIGGFLADTGQFYCGNAKPSDRWDILRKHFNIKLPCYDYKKKDNIVVALQLPQDASLRGASIEKWCRDTCLAIRTQTDKPIIIRLPQLQRDWDVEPLEVARKLPNVEFQMGTADNLIPTLRNARCTVTYTSGLGVDSLLNGCPTVACNPGSFAYDVAPHTVDHIEEPECPSRDQWLYNLSYCQWHVSEIENGLPWRHLKQMIT